MITKCANPSCDTPFHYFRGGRLYCFELRSETLGVRSQRRLTVHFWICARCNDTLSLQFDTKRGVFLSQSWEADVPPKQLHCNACSGN